MRRRVESDRCAKSPRGSNGTRDNSTGPQSRAGRRSKLLWPVLATLTVFFLTASLTFLWPIFKMGGIGFALFMVVAVAALSLGPLLLLRKVINSASADRGKKPNEEEHIL